MSNTLSNQMVEWNTIPWRKLERRVFKLQKRIFRASLSGDIKATRRLQKTLMRSWSAKTIATREVADLGEYTLNHAMEDTMQGYSEDCQINLKEAIAILKGIGKDEAEGLIESLTAQLRCL